MSLFGLSERGKEFRATIKGAVAKGIGANRTIALIKSTYGRAYKRTTFLSDYRIIKKAKDTFEPMKYIRKGYKPDIGHYQMASITHERRFATVVSYTYSLRGEKEVLQSYYTIRHDDLLTVGEIEDTILSAIERKYEVENIGITGTVEAYEFKKPTV